MGLGPVCFTEPGLMKVIEHAAYVIAEAAILIMLAQRAKADARAGEELARIADTFVSRDGTINFAATRTASRAPTTQKLVGALQHIESALTQVLHTSPAIDRGGPGNLNRAISGNSA